MWNSGGMVGEDDVIRTLMEFQNRCDVQGGEELKRVLGKGRGGHGYEQHTREDGIYFV